MEREVVFFSENVPLHATIGYPEQTNGPFPAIVLLHGHGRHRNDGLDALSERLNAVGFVTFRFDFRGCGKTMYARYEIICDTHCPEDARNAISYIMTEAGVDASRIGIAGVSLGASTAVYVAGTDQRIRCAVSLAGVGDYQRHFQRSCLPERLAEIEGWINEDRYSRVRTGHSRWVLSSEIGARTAQESVEFIVENTRDIIWGSANSNYTTVAGVESLLRYCPEKVCPRIHIPILFLQGAEDELVDAAESRSMFEKVPSSEKDFRILSGVDHNMPIHPRRQEVFNHIVDWFSAHL